MSNDEALLEELAALALKAGAEIMRVYAEDFAVEAKGDASPVTKADHLSERIILDGLGRIAPDIPVLAEERASAGDIPALGETFFLVDPLDGTREFIGRNGEFTVNIALVRHGRPALGVVYAPALGKLYAGAEKAFRLAVTGGTPGPRETIRARTAPPGGLVAVASRSHRTPETDAFLKDRNVADFTAAGSSLKFCLIAEGAADVYPRFGRTMEWDTAAGQAVLEAAGGRVLVHPEETPLVYGKAWRGFDNPHFVAWGVKT
ncbi:3'(2'),5'-bisphosphate nucleotidase CysQ [Amphiplicatus metriothermophilus]|uniref:3'(2'),5'-bisphosphate nucleotidase CysQ n=1 Tax=Amphiplicatus metriothermophilus TaxID=1519374 RepID=A0A239PJU1_9PROT|nr:3'(2'),5'-bisphosphate nucleotidase CysQ [Amphiplicatus metriothermophilus]MBB5517856.1 3'(2'),5'-bisphosphate nucleotidase [Amphiplicatus metriothermophilus]SNT67810.1 3'(2'),5'-bisphosphate nucleotidase [Amphiplicatus metriothermophilus]